MTYLVDNNLKPTKVASTNDPYTIGLADGQFLALSGQTITLPEITASMVGRSFLIKLGEAHSADVTVARSGTDTIEGGTSYTITSDYGFVELMASTGKWLVVKESKEIANDEALRINKRTSTSDPSILVNANNTSASSESNAVVLEVQRGTTGANAQLKWNETTDSWEIPTHNLVVGGNLTINGTTTTINSTTTTVDDPIFTLGGDTAPSSDDNKDRGIEFRWHNGTAAKVGFFGYDDSASAFTFIPDATNSSEVFSGTAGSAVFGSITSTTATLTDNSTTVATTEFVQKAALGISTKTASYTLVLGDAGKLVEFNSASNLTLTIPANSSVAFPVGTQIVVARLGSGKVNIAITSDTLYSVSSNRYISSQYGAVTLVKRTSTTWYLFGDLSAS
jgi:hypothetical protein